MDTREQGVSAAPKSQPVFSATEKSAYRRDAEKKKRELSTERHRLDYQKKESVWLLTALAFFSAFFLCASESRQ
jgi:hypothetical protein